MGGRGASSGGGSGGGGGGGGGIANQAPTPQNTPVVPNAVTNLTQMSDDQLANLYLASRTVDMPNHLNDVNNPTQKFVYAAGVNEKPLVLDQAAFDQYLKDNNIPSYEILARSTNGANYTVNGTNMRLSPTQTTDLIKYGSLNYVGGKHGGDVYGNGTYMDMNGGQNTGYGRGTTMIGVLSPTARTINKQQLLNKIPAFSQKNPKFARAVGSPTNNKLSIYALAMGYNVITSSGGYHNIIDRSALVLRKNDL